MQKGQVLFMIDISPKQNKFKRDTPSFSGLAREKTGYSAIGWLGDRGVEGTMRLAFGGVRSCRCSFGC
jgi:hypothetical protein